MQPLGRSRRGSANREESFTGVDDHVHVRIAEPVAAGVTTRHVSPSVEVHTAAVGTNSPRGMLQPRSVLPRSPVPRPFRSCRRAQPIRLVP